MRKIGYIGLTAVLTLGASGCAQDSSPTATPLQQEVAPSFDGGFLGGSGNREDTTAVGNTMSTTADSTGRGGFLGGSGN